MDAKNFIRSFIEKNTGQDSKIYNLLAWVYLFKNNCKYYLKNPSLLTKKIDHGAPLDIKETINVENRNCFFGYYDKSPWDYTGRYLLYLSAPIINKHPDIYNEAFIGYIDLTKRERNYVAKTRAWNWQQGCMMKWLKNKGQEPIFIYNDYKSGRFVSIIRHLKKGIIKILPFPIYTVNELENEALSLNFKRVHNLRPGYGYNSGDYTLGENYTPSDDGIYRLNLKNKKVELVLPIDKISKDIGNQNKYHWINHIKYNPSGTRAVFLHRCKYNNKKVTRMVTMNPDGTELYCLSDNGSISHFTWKNDKEILATGKLGSSNNYNYYLFEDKATKVQNVGGDSLCRNGHPTYSPDGEWILTDTYPDKGGWKDLILYNTKENQKYIISRFYTPIKYRYGTLRTDLHPRWSRDGNEICFDSAHEGYRKMYVLDVEKSTNVFESNNS